MNTCRIVFCAVFASVVLAYGGEAGDLAWGYDRSEQGEYYRAGYTGVLCAACQ